MENPFLFQVLILILIKQVPKKGIDPLRYFFMTIFFTGLLVTLTGGSKLARDEVQFTFRQELDHYDFNGAFNVTADPHVVWQVLTDYDHFSNFISNMHCHIRQQDGNDLLVQQTVGGGFLFIREEIKGLLKVHEQPFDALTLQEISQKSFKLYQGSWKIKPDPSGNAAVVTYELEAEKNSHTPHFVTPDLFRQSTEDLMVEMKREIERREAKRQKELPIISKK